MVQGGANVEDIFADGWPKSDRDNGSSCSSFPHVTTRGGRCFGPRGRRGLIAVDAERERVNLLRMEA